MKKTQFSIGLLTACLLGVSSVASAQSCGAESCDSKSCKCSQTNCDDKGLLEVINHAASSVEAKLAGMIPDGDKPRTHAKCGCSKCSPPSDFAIHYIETAPSPPVATHDALNAKQPLAQPEITRSPVPRSSTKLNAVPDPVPRSGKRESDPLPDSRVDPFTDELTPINRPIPARPASSLRSSGKTQFEFDPQASHQKSSRSISNSKAVSKSISDSDHGLARTTSTRRRQPLVDVLEQASADVVAASVSIPVSSLRSSTAAASAAEQFVNPLRTK